MKKILLSVALLIAGVTNAQVLLTENFDVFPGATSAPGNPDQWVRSNQSTPFGASTWAQGGGTSFSNTGAHSGGPTSFTLCNFNSTTGAGTISNWLFAPVVTLKNGDVISFWTRQGGTGPSYADRMQMRIATDWSGFSAFPTTGAADVGDFQILATDINPNLIQDGYPLVWTNYTYTMSGLDGEVPCRIAFRYFVANGGPTGDNSNIIGLDTFSVDRPLSTEGFFASNFAVSPNPATNILNVHARTGAAMTEIQLTDMNGRVVKTTNAAKVSETQINVSDLSAGVYLLKITTDAGVGTSKIIKK